MTDSTQLIVNRGRNAMVLLISSCTQFLTLKVAVALTLILIAGIEAALRGVVLHIQLVKAQSFRLVYCFLSKKNVKD